MIDMVRGALAVVLCMVCAHQGNAFGTLNFLGQSAEHEKITALGLKPFKLGSWTLSELKGRARVFGAVGAPDRPSRGLLFTAAAHCDGGDWLALKGYPHDKASAVKVLSACRKWIFDHLRKAVAAAGDLVDSDLNIVATVNTKQQPCHFSGAEDTPKCNVLAAMGLVFHAVQDFYSHSNWTDVATGRPVSVKDPPGLGGEGPIPWLDPRRSEATMPDGLISGCFSGIPERLFCRRRVRHADLNKDTGPINIKTGKIGRGTTPRAKGNDNFQRVVAAAIADTEDKWRYFEERLIETYGPDRGNRIICVIRNDDVAGCRK